MISMNVDAASSTYDHRALAELRAWQQQMLSGPSLWNQATRGLQRRVNRMIPEQVHETVTTVIGQMTRAVLSGASYVTTAVVTDEPLAVREARVHDKLALYRRTAAAEGGVTGAGGLLLGLADFPLLFSLKLKLLFEIAALYGYSGDDYTERIYLLHVFQLAFSGDEHRRSVYGQMVDWREQRRRLPTSLAEFDWRTFQQEYRDYIDLVKLAQLVPIIGAPVGAIANHRLVNRLGHMAMNAYRMRWFEDAIAVAMRSALVQ